MWTEVVGMRRGEWTFSRVTTNVSDDLVWNEKSSPLFLRENAINMNQYFWCF
jgi:hypothetical protein